MGHFIGVLATLILLAPSADAPQIKSTTKLTIIDSRGMVEITAPEVLALSNVYAGEFIGAPAESPDAKFARHTIVFDIQTLRGVKHGAYAVQFVWDDSTGEAFIHLAGSGEPAYRSNVSTIIRDGKDGGWHHASAEWARLIRTYLR